MVCRLSLQLMSPNPGKLGHTLVDSSGLGSCRGFEVLSLHTAATLGVIPRGFHNNECPAHSPVESPDAAEAPQLGVEGCCPQPSGTWEG